MEVRCTPRILSGTVKAVSSKSDAHRLLICSALCEETTKIYCNVMSRDIAATVNCLKAMGTKIETEDGAVTVTPSEFKKTAELDCSESGSTLRFLLPVLSSLNIKAKITARGRLPERPLSPLKEEMERHGVTFSDEFPLEISGQLRAGEYTLAGNVSSQFVTGLLFALPLLEGDSKITLLPPVESKSYIDITLNALRKFGIEIKEENNIYIIKGNQKYLSPREAAAEGDWSNAAFFLSAGAVSKDGVTVEGLDMSSPQGDRKIIDILKRMGADVEINGDSVTVRKNKLYGALINARDIPDLVPILSVAAAFCDKGVTEIINASRLRLKECDRLFATSEILTNVGAAVSETDDGLVIWGENELTGGSLKGYNDHRMVMASAVLSCLCTLPVDIDGAEAVNKSYPSFFEDFNKLGGNSDVINDGK